MNVEICTTITVVVFRQQVLRRAMARCYFRGRVPFFVQALRNAAFPQMLSFKNNNGNASLNVHTKTFPYRLFL
jgi:hypothetical protein